MASDSEHPYLIAFCTCPPEKAAGIARELVRRKVCACINVVPGLRSVYAWKGSVEEDEESLLVIKTRADRFDSLERAIRDLHPYEVFELVASRLNAGNAAYLRWIDECLDAGASLADAG